jgi:hypothetical protein
MPRQKREKLRKQANGDTKTVCRDHVLPGLGHLMAAGCLSLTDSLGRFDQTYQSNGPRDRAMGLHERRSKAYTAERPLSQRQEMGRGNCCRGRVGCLTTASSDDWDRCVVRAIETTSVAAIDDVPLRKDWCGLRTKRPRKRRQHGGDGKRRWIGLRGAILNRVQADNKRQIGRNH